MSPKFMFVVMVAFLAIPSITQAQTMLVDETIVVLDETVEHAPDETIVVYPANPEVEHKSPSVSRRPTNQLSTEEIQRRVAERAVKIKADKEEAARKDDLRKSYKTREERVALGQVEEEAKRDLKAFKKAEVVGCSPDETVVHPEANTKTWGPKVTFEVHNPHDYPIDIMNRTEMMIEKLCSRGKAKVSVSAFVMGPIVSYGSPYAPYGGRRRDGRDRKIVQLTAMSEYGVVFTPEIVVDYYQTLYEGNRRDPYVWIVPDPPQEGQMPGQAGMMTQMQGGPGVSRFGTSRELSVPMPGYIQRSLMRPSQREALDRQAEPVVPDEVIEISPDDNR